MLLQHASHGQDFIIKSISAVLFIIKINVIWFVALNYLINFYQKTSENVTN